MTEMNADADGYSIPFDLLPEIPETVITKDGQEVSLKNDVWRIRLDVKLDKAVVLNWAALRSLTAQDGHTKVLSGRAIHLSMLYAAHSLPRLKANSAKGVYKAVLKFSRWLAANQQWMPPGRSYEWSDLSEDAFNSWLRVEGQTAAGGLFPMMLRQFYRWGADPDAPYSDFSWQLSQILDDNPIVGHPTGEAVLSRDNRRGPFNREELELILEACKSGRGREHDRAVVWVLFDTAMRPEQLTLLRNRDLQTFEGCDEEGGSGTGDGRVERLVYQLKTPIIKQRQPGEQYRPLPVSTGCGQLLERLRKLGSGSDEPLLWWLWKDFHKCVLISLERFFQDADLRSPRLPVENPGPGGPAYEIMPVTTRRFRYSLASGRIARGELPESVSDFLCQTDLSSVRHYVETAPSIADDFQRATDHAVAPLIRRMQGRVDDPDNPSDAPLIPGIVPQSSPGRELRVIGAIGKCGAGGYCPRNPVTGCFGCPSFVARPDAPLRELRAAVLEDIESDLSSGASPLIIDQLRATIGEIDLWIEHIERAKSLGLRLQITEMAVKE